MPSKSNGSYKDANFVFVLRNVKTDEILRGARNNNSPFFASELAAFRKCQKINNNLKSYSSCEYGDLYKVTKYRLERMNDILVDEELIRREIRR